MDAKSRRTVVFVDEVGGGVQGGQDAQAQQVDLDHAGRGHIVLVATEDRAALGRGPLHGHELADRLAGEDHAAGVHAQVTRQRMQMGREVADVRGHVGLRPGRGLVEVAGHLPDPGRRVAQDPGGVGHGELGLVADDVGDLGTVVPAVAVEDVLNDLFAPGGFEVDVDVGRAAALRGQEPFEQQTPVAQDVDGGDPQDETHERAGGRTAALAPDAAADGELADVVDDQEVAGHAQLGDDREFVVELPPRSGGARGVALAVAGGAGPLGQVAQPRVFVVPGRCGEAGQFGPQLVEVDHQGAAQLQGRLQHAGVAGEPGGHLRVAAQMRGRGRHQVAGGALQGLAAAQGGDGLCEAGLARGGVVDGAGRDHGQAQAVSRHGHDVVGHRVLGKVMVGQLGVHTNPEHLDQALQAPGDRGHVPPVAARGGASRQHHPLARGGRRGERREVVAGCALVSGQLRGADHRRQPAEAGQAAGEDDRRSQIRVAEGEFGAEDGADPGRFRGFRQAPRTVQAVPVSEGEHGDPQPGCLGDEFVRLRAALHEAEGRVDVELRPGRRCGRR